MKVNAASWSATAWAATAGANPAHEIGSQCEYAHFKCHRQPDRPAKPNHGHDSLPIEAPPMAEEVKSSKPPLDRYDSDQPAAHCQPGQRAAQAAAPKPQRRKTEMTEDQRPAQHRVDQDSHDAQPQDDARTLQRRDKVTQKLKQQPRRGAPHVGAQERLPLARQFLRDAEGTHQIPDVPQQQPVRRQHRGDQPHSGAESAAHIPDGVEVLAERRRHYRR